MRLYSLSLALLVLLVYGQTVTFPFVNLDDPEYVTSNQAVLDGLTPASVIWAFDPTGYAANWHPLTWLSLMLDVELYGGWSGGFHLTNVILHALNCLLLFRFLSRQTGEANRSFLVAALFAVHPLHVESVAWISERKDVLSTFFALLSLTFYGRYARASGRGLYVGAWCCLLLSLMSKQMYVTLPALFLVLDDWPFGRVKASRADQTQATNSGGDFARTWTHLILEKIPFVALTLVFCGVAVWAQQAGGAMNSPERISFGARLANAAVSCVIYLRQTLWPMNLAVFYPLPRGGRSVLEVAACAALLCGVTVWALRRPYRRTGWMWFVIALLPVIGIIQVGEQAHADRYMYFPQIGLLIAVTWSIASALQRWTWGPRAAPYLSAIVLLASSAVAWKQTRYWSNSVSLFRHTLEVTDENWFAHATLATALMDTPGQIRLAQDHLRESLRVRPNNLTAHYNLALLLTEEGDLEQANQHFRQVLLLNPSYVHARAWLSVNLKQLGQVEELERIRVQWEGQEGPRP